MADGSPFASPEILDLLACPECLGALRVSEGELRCNLCERVYPVVDGIPALTREQAKSGPNPPR